MSSIPKRSAQLTPLELQIMKALWDNLTSFFTLNLKVTDGVLGGTAVHCTQVAWVGGELIPSSDETTTEKILEAHASGKKLLIKTADGSNESDAISLEFNLTAKDEADAKLPLDKTQNGPPPQKKPWHFQRVGGTQ